MTDRRPDDAVDDSELREWRRRAADLVIVASILLHLPLVVLVFLGIVPFTSTPARLAVGGAYLASIAVAVLRRIDHEVRTWVLLASIYSLALIGVLSAPASPFMRVLPMVAPLLAIGLIGVGAARIAAVVSGIVMTFAPFLIAVPGVAKMFGRGDSPASVGAAPAWVPGLALTVETAVLMVLLERFYGFILQSLASARQSARERTAATRKLEAEIEERRRLEHEIARIGDDERRYLGTEVHDGVCQQLTGALLRCQALELRLERGTPPTTADLNALSCLLGETIHEARAVAEGLCPLEPRPDALERALRALANRTRHLSGVPCAFTSSGNVLVPDSTTAQHLYRITQEAVSNAVRHARASRITVELLDDGDVLTLRVQDDGVGMPESVRVGGMGLRTMSFRARVIEAAFGIDASPSGGTRVSCGVPRSSCEGPRQVTAPIVEGASA